MHKQIYVNLPVKDLARSRQFFSRLGFEFNAQFSNEDAACMILGENIFAMLLVERFFQRFTSKPVSDASTSTEVLTCLSCESRAEVDALVAKALEAGGRAPNPKQDHGFMYGHGFEDLDGHLWELSWMDASAIASHP
jgi:predicted lactoylglutathione lyase